MRVLLSGRESIVNTFSVVVSVDGCDLYVLLNLPYTRSAPDKVLQYRRRTVRDLETQLHWH
jgi:hypothetical protein